MTCTMRPRQTLASARRDGGPPRGVCPAGGGGAGGGLGDGATSRAGRRRAFEGSLPRAAGGLGPRSPAGRSRAVCGSAPRRTSVASALGSFQKRTARLCVSVRVRRGGPQHAVVSTPAGARTSSPWPATLHALGRGFVVTYGKDRDAGPGRRRVSPRSKAPGPTAPCPVGP